MYALRRVCVCVYEYVFVYACLYDCVCVCVCVCIRETIRLILCQHTLLPRSSYDL
jgi:hypothetical protein